MRKPLKIAAIVLGGLLAGTVLVFGALLFNFYDETRDPPGPRSCECELLEQWATTLPLTPSGDHLQRSDLRASEDHGGFSIGGSGLEDVTIDRQAILNTLTAHGLEHRTDIDQPDRWNAIFYPGAEANEEPWSFDVTAGWVGVGIRLWLGVDGSAWGLETNDDVHDFYVEDHQAALIAQEERQRQAIETLQPLREALQSMVQDR